MKIPVTNTFYYIDIVCTNLKLNDETLGELKNDTEQTKVNTNLLNDVN